MGGANPPLNRPEGVNNELVNNELSVTSMKDIISFVKVLVRVERDIRFRLLIITKSMREHGR